MDKARLEEHDLYVLKGIVEGLEEEQSIDPSIAVKFIVLIEDELARQAPDGEIQAAIEWLEHLKGCWVGPDIHNLYDLAIAALRAYKPEPDCESAEWAGGKCCGYGKSETDDEPIDACKACPKQSTYGVE